MITAVNYKSILEMSAAHASTLMTGKHNSTVTVTVHRGEGTDAKTITGVPASSFPIWKFSGLHSLECQFIFAQCPSWVALY